MSYSGDFQLDFLKRLAFNRYGGTDDELRASLLISESIRALGGNPATEEFRIPAYRIHRAAFSVVSPFVRTVEVNGIGRTGSTCEGGITADFLYVEDADEFDLRNARGKIVLANKCGYESYKRIVGSGAVAFVLFSGRFCDDVNATDLDKPMLRPVVCENGTIPGVCMRTADAIRLLQDNAERVRLELIQDEYDATSRNVTAFIEGSEYPDEILLMTAHYDSTIYGCGAWDNASGSANLLEMFRYFSDNRPKRSIRFVWCGSEEQGLLGSTAYRDAHPDEVGKMIFCINFDMTGPTLGAGLTMVTGNQALHSYVAALCNELGYTGLIQEDVHSSDSAPFALHGVPAVGVARSGQAGGHSRFDVVMPLSASALERATDFAKVLAERFLNAKIPPVAREISPEMQAKLEKYFRYGKKTD